MPPKAGSRKIRRAPRGRLALRDVVGRLDELFARVTELEKRKGPSGRRRRRSPKLSPRRLADLKLQGAYMGFVRQLGPRQMARVKALRASKGYPAAIALAKKMAAR